nr:gamma-glutamylcyclotransferase [Candidatus Poseidoniaceae archaeon]
VPGALFEMDEKAHKAMDRKEGHPNYYERRDVNVILPDGTIVKALTYTVVDEKILNYHEPPTEKYAGLISNGLQRLGLPTQFLDAAVNDSSAGVGLSDIFVYGTLMQDQSRNAALNSHPHELLGSGSVVGGLVDLGDFPGLTNKESMVHGELYTVSDISRLISDIDRIEGFYGYGQQNSLFTRMVIEVECGASKHWAWTYIYNGEDGIEIPSGDWRNRNH